MILSCYMNNTIYILILYNNIIMNVKETIMI